MPVHASMPSILQDLAEHMAVVSVAFVPSSPLSLDTPSLGSRTSGVNELEQFLISPPKPLLIQELVNSKIVYRYYCCPEKRDLANLYPKSQSLLGTANVSGHSWPHYLRDRRLINARINLKIPIRTSSLLPVLLLATR
ncbi:hypothetical protein FIBSPDRAFT_216148 [Athelia psychrophila]|uniref:Uncharacterized protein n=1 Tax=Athelia psychrophila TaxID=1759441 RepID=A0A166SEQ8_9AGAM|nr:hypothetical protein FIBSPDRAFT_216148 [Fibularhizoctonia sp. CBS 109695]